eukprot:COSAG02_NODE_56129_length_287_cov_0.648936_1_plen_70_part_10
MTKKDICLTLKHRPYYFSSEHESALPLLASLAKTASSLSAIFPEQTTFFQAEDGIRDFWMWLEFRRVLFR